MARKRKTSKIRTARVPFSDEELMRRLKEQAPEVLSASVPEEAFDKVVQNLLRDLPKKKST
jgi:hypothetical protein